MKPRTREANAAFMNNLYASYKRVEDAAKAILEDEPGRTNFQEVFLLDTARLTALAHIHFLMETFHVEP